MTLCKRRGFVVPSERIVLQEEGANSGGGDEGNEGAVGGDGGSPAVLVLTKKGGIRVEDGEVEEVDEMKKEVAVSKARKGKHKRSKTPTKKQKQQTPKKQQQSSRVMPRKERGGGHGGKNQTTKQRKKKLRAVSWGGAHAHIQSGLKGFMSSSRSSKSCRASLGGGSWGKGMRNMVAENKGR